MSNRRMHLRAIAFPLTRAHLVDLLESYEDSGFFRGFDEAAIARNDAVRRASPADVQPTDVFIGTTPLAGRAIGSVSMRMQTYALAPTIEAFPGVPYGTFLGEEAVGLVGMPLVISGILRDQLAAIYERHGIDFTEMAAFLDENLGYTAAITGE